MAGTSSPSTGSKYAFAASTTGQRAAALKKCKKRKSNTARKKCRKRASRLPI
jgi:hypothetical protein